MSALSEMLAQANTEGWSVQKVTDRARHLGHDIGRDTVWKYMSGRHGPVQEKYLRAFADVFPKVKLTNLRSAAAAPADFGEWVPPVESRALNAHERNALSLIIKAMVRAKVDALAGHQGGSDDGALTAPEPRLAFPDERPASIPREQSDRRVDPAHTGAPQSARRPRRAAASPGSGSTAPKRQREEHGEP